jgi:hypothetical protein
VLNQLDQWIGAVSLNRVTVVNAQNDGCCQTKKPLDNVYTTSAMA